MSSSYANYLATTTFKANSFGSVSGLGTSARTTASVLLGGPRAGAGSAYRIYSYAVNNNPGLIDLYKLRIDTLLNKRGKYYINQFSRNYSLGPL
jgi:hypothetical protein